ncbi:MAG TPA: ATP-binding protein [Anaeromyxobacteraceae bacterium]|jgi:two-component system sensor histidine kinase RegB|nr:ATP-binding protein [Anaeromyxobacteraceae bacterium]
MSMPAGTLEAAPNAAREPVWPHVRGGQPDRIKLSWIIKLHWGGIFGQALAIAAARWVVGIDVPLLALFGILLVEVVENVGLELWLRRGGKVGERFIATVMFADAFILTALLALSGGYSNPFSTMYLVNVALATVLLDATWAWAMLGTSLALFGSLFGLHHLGVLQVLSSLDHAEIMSLHMQGMWVSFAVAAAFIVYVVARVQRALTQLEEELAAERSLSARKDKVASLATLAAGAAHELSTPLSTIAVVVKELMRSAERSGASPSSVEDLALIREQVKRCRDILHHMSAQAGENAGEPIVELPLAAWIDEAMAFLPDPTRVVLRAETDLGAHAVAGPPRGLARALRSLLKNAVQASPAGNPVLLRVAVEGGCVRAQVVDHGCGMPQEILSRAGEPFFTTKVPGEGMGLGLFLTHTLAEELGGSLELNSTPGSGTTATLKLPVTFHVPAAPQRRSEAP